MAADVLCEIPITGTEMEVTSTVVTNSSSNDSNTELSMCSGSNSSGSLHLAHVSPGPVASLTHHHLQQPQHHNLTATTNLQSAHAQRQILVDSNGQIIGNFLVQQQQRHHQQQLLQQAAQQLSFQAAQHQHQQQSSVATFTARHQQQHPQTQQNINQQPQIASKLLPVIRKTFEINTNGGPQSQFLNVASSGRTAGDAPASAIASCHYVRDTVAQALPQRFTLQQQQHLLHPRNFVNTTPTSVVTSGGTQSSNTTLGAAQQQIQLQQQLNSLQSQLGVAAQNQQRLQQRQLQLQQQQHSQQSNLSTTPKYIAKQLSIISLPNHSTGATVTIPSSAAVAAVNTVNNTAHNSNLVNDMNITTALKSITPSDISTTIAHQQPRQAVTASTKQTSQKGRKTSSKLPPGAVNLERSYQICQAVIQNSPNRENLKAQLRPPAALLNQQQQQQQQQNLSQSSQLVGGIDGGQQSPVTNNTGNFSLTMRHQGLKGADELVVNTATSGLPTNVMGVGRPGVYKVPLSSSLLF